MVPEFFCCKEAITEFTSTWNRKNIAGNAKHLSCTSDEFGLLYVFQFILTALNFNSGLVTVEQIIP